MKTNKNKNRVLKRYECENVKCKKLWSLLPEGIIMVGAPAKFAGYDRKGYKKYRREGYCECGTPFNHPHIQVNVEEV